MPALPTPLFSAPYRAHHFPPGTVPPYGDLDFTTDDLAHALFVTGRAPGDRYAFAAASFWEFVHRTSIIPSYIRWRGGQLLRSRLAMELDRSEKVGLSYAGLTP